MRYIDISPQLSQDIAVFPGDIPFERKVAMSFNNGDHLLLSSIGSTLHVGAHADAPNHYHHAGCDIASRSLDLYLGPCQVIDIELAPDARIFPADLSGIEIRAPRVLFKTGSFPDPNHWNSDFNSLSPELIQWLAAKGVILVGIDTPSIDPEQSKHLESHQAVYQHDLAILEGLILSKTTPGIYILVALPLPIKDADASPVRAILLPAIPEDWQTLIGARNEEL